MALPYWRLSSFYLIYFASVGGFMPYWSLYLKDAGYNPMQIGQLSALLIGTRIIAPNLWGWLADRSGKSLPIIRIACFLAAVFFTGFLFAKSYLEFALITVGFSFFWNAALPQFEAATLLHLHGEPQHYSRIRLWGSVGFIIAVLGVGRWLDTQPISLLPTIVICLLTGIWLITLIVPDAHPREHGHDAVGIFKILQQPTVIAFLTVGMLLQIAHAPYYVFYSIYLKSYHYSATLTGSLWALGVIAEILLFVFMKKILAFCSLRNILLFSILLAMSRWLIISWGADQLSMLIVAQLLHAASFGSTHIATIHLVHRYFGLQHQGKGQALYSSLSMGLGGMLGSFYSGYFWEQIGGQIIYSIGAGFCVCAFCITFLWVGREKKRPISSLS